MNRRRFLGLFSGVGLTAIVKPSYLIAPIGLPPVPEKIEGTAVSYDDLIQGGSKRYVHLTYGLSFKTTKEMLKADHELYSHISKT